MSSTLRRIIVAAVLLAAAPSARAADLFGTAADPSGAPLPGARVTVHNLATGAEQLVLADASGRFHVENLSIGIYRVAVELDGFSEDARSVSFADAAERQEVVFVLRPGGLTMGVTVTATRSERDTMLVPLRTDNLQPEEIAARAPASTGDALVLAPGITPVGSGPYGVRPRLRGLDSTRLLVLVDGERLNNARTATDRSGTEVGLIDLSTVDSLEVVSGAGSVLYGTDALAGTINIITNQPRFSDRLKLTYGFDGLFSSNESGGRGAVTIGASSRRAAVQFSGGMESYGDYEAGSDAKGEDTRPYYQSGQIKQADTIDDNFGFNFNAFPEPFNAPYVRDTAQIPFSGARGDNINASGIVALTDSQTLQVKYIRRHMEHVGFPDFQEPAFFQEVSLPFSDLDRVSARYEARSLTRWLSNLRVSLYYQDQDRLLRNEFPVQFPVPSPAFFPINVFRLQILSDTEQHVRTPGVDVQGTILAAHNHTLTTGFTLYRDRSEDRRTSTTQTTLVGNVSLGARGPQANVFPAPVPLGDPTTTHPSRVPDASFRDLGVFAQDEWDLTHLVRLVSGLRVDGYQVETDPTPGYEVASLVAGAVPPIDPSTLPNIDGERIARTAVTGDVGVVFRPSDRVSFLARYGRSYRHANLEELLFSGSATVGYIVPNIKVGPETGNNVDVGVKYRSSRYAASLSYFNNTYNGFISTEIVATGPSGPLSQAINFADVRIQGVEGDGEVPVTLRPGVLTFFGTVAFTRGTVLSGENQLTGASLAGTPQDNITPLKTNIGVRFADAHDRYWVEYGARVQSDVTRVATTLIDSPYLIPQDLLSLQGFAVQRVAAGMNLAPGGNRFGLTVAIENLADTFYREQFQFAPARGRTFTVGLRIRGG